MSHAFSVRLSAGGDALGGEVVAEGVDRGVSFAIPEAFGGPGGEWAPEHFFAAAVASCVLATFLSAAKQSKLALTGCDCTATATMDKTSDGLRMTAVEVRPTIRVAEERDRQRAERLIRKAESLCPISNSVASRVTLKETIEVD